MSVSGSDGGVALPFYRQAGTLDKCIAAGCDSPRDQDRLRCLVHHEAENRAAIERVRRNKYHGRLVVRFHNRIVVSGDLRTLTNSGTKIRKAGVA